MKILFIGNSFSFDANVYLWKIAEAAGFDLTAVNLNIGGCSLERHARNIEGNLCEYRVQYNGVHIPGLSATLLDGLRYKDWDYVSVQQVSGLSGMYETYYPYIETLVSLIRKECPNAKLLVHETWAYEVDSTHQSFPNYNCSQSLMHKSLKETYARVAKEINAHDIVPSGDVIARLREFDTFNVEKGGESLARDGFHMGLIYGRYAVAATWFQKLKMGDIEENTFLPAEDVDLEKIALIKKVVKEICK
jgi:hypothetical protein